MKTQWTLGMFQEEWNFQMWKSSPAQTADQL